MTASSMTRLSISPDIWLRLFVSSSVSALSSILIDLGDADTEIGVTASSRMTRESTIWDK